MLLGKRLDELDLYLNEYFKQEQSESSLGNFLESNYKISNLTYEGGDRFSSKV